MTTLDTTAPDGGRAMPAVVAAVLIMVLTVVPMAVAVSVGFLERCVRLIVAASVEAYLIGRGRRE